MSLTVALMEALRASDGFTVWSPDGREGVVDEIWLGPEGEPSALAVGTRDGSRGLLLAEDVGAVDPVGRRVAVRPGARILELGGPHPEPAVPAEPARSVQPPQERSLVASIAVLYVTVLVIVVVVTGLTFGIAWLVAGRPF
jgi:hypothetical protein